ncbi:hypothetical protein ABZV31_05405 [Streptomyces sp. NPDC005202]
MHYPHDVVAGVAVGGLDAPLSMLTPRRRPGVLVRWITPTPLRLLLPS